MLVVSLGCGFVWFGGCGFVPISLNVFFFFDDDDSDRDRDMEEVIYYFNL